MKMDLNIILLKQNLFIYYILLVYIFVLYIIYINIRIIYKYSYLCNIDNYIYIDNFMKIYKNKKNKFNKLI